MAQIGKFWVLAVKYFTWTPIHRFPPAAAVCYDCYDLISIYAYMRLRLH